MSSLRTLIYIIFLLVFTFFAAEILLRVFHPFPVRLKGDKIVLPQNQVYVVKNTNTLKMDEKIIHTKNSLGFRGDEKPEGFKNYISMLTVGGSTTECFYINDGKDWPHLVGENLKNKFGPLWINNAGLEGHSTIGYQILLDDYITKLHPKVVLFLTGINDIGVENLRAEERHNLVSEHQKTFSSMLADHSEVFNLIRILQKAHNANKMNLTDKNIDLHKLDILTLSNKESKKNVAGQISHSINYKERILKLIETCRSHNIEPVLITQPVLYGAGIDSLTGVNLATIKIDREHNGKEGWKILQLYNDRVREAGKETGTYVIDLANEMPKNSVYFYDLIHYTNQGCAEVADIISQNMCPFLQSKFSKYCVLKPSTLLGYTNGLPGPASGVNKTQ
jgi:lysophospholipase L1-like esterase